MSLKVIPCSLRTANAFIKQHHRHNTSVLVARIVLAAADECNQVRGVGIAALPVSRSLDTGDCLEARRVCTDGYRNACSFLYAALWRAAQCIGYTSMITYTLTTESRSSIKGVNWQFDGEIKGRSWDTPARRRTTLPVSLLDKYRWRVSVPEKVLVQV